MLFSFIEGVEFQLLQDRVLPVDLEQEAAESALENEAAISSPSKRQRVIVPDADDLDLGSNKKDSAVSHANTLMGKIARSCLTKAVRSRQDLDQLQAGIHALAIRREDGSLVLPAGSACSGTDIWIFNMQALSHFDYKCGWG